MFYHTHFLFVLYAKEKLISQIVIQNIKNSILMHSYCFKMVKKQNNKFSSHYYYIKS